LYLQPLVLHASVVAGRSDSGREPQTHVKPEAASTFFELLSSKHFEQLRNVGIINSNTWSHLVSYF